MKYRCSFNALLITTLVLSGFSLLFLYSCGGDEDDPKIKVTSVSLNTQTLKMEENSTGNLFASIQPSNATNKSVSWDSSSPSVVDVDENGNLTSKVAGTAIITVTTIDGGYQNQCVVTVLKSDPGVLVESVSLNKHSSMLELTAEEQLSETIEPANAENKTVIWTTNDETVLTVTNGLVTPKKVGTATVYVTTQDGAKTDQCTFSIYDKRVVTGVSLDKTSIEKTEGSTYQLTATVEPSTATNQNVTWSSSNTSVAEVSTSGLVSMKKAGSATITVTTLEGAKTATCSVSVIVDVTKVTGVTLNETSMQLIQGATQQLTPTIQPATAVNQAVSWSSTNSSVASVSNGLITAHLPGSTTITAKTSDGGFEATCQVYVYKIAVVSIDITNPPTQMNNGTSVNLNYSILPADATNKNVSWSSSNTSVATVTNGTLQAKGRGFATITVISADNNNIRDNFDIEVLQPVTQINLDKWPIINAKEGDYITVTATVLPDNANNKHITWTSTDTDIATVDAYPNNNLKATIHVKDISTPSAGVGITATADNGVDITVSVLININN